MTMRRLFLAAALAALAPLSARAATNEPHGYMYPAGVSCTTCHTLHNAPGAEYTAFDGNALLCESCHNSGSIGAAWGFPWWSTYQATPLAAQPAGRHHRWDADAVNPALGAELPQLATISGELDQTTTPGTPKIQCSTCHDQHNASATYGGAQYVSKAVGTTLAPSPGTGAGRVTIVAPAATAAAKAYLVEIVLAGNTGVATYKLSNDAGRTWLGWNTTTSQWVAFTTSPSNARITGANHNLNDTNNVANVKVTFSGNGFVERDQWSFYVSYPFLRESIIASKLCEDCHRSMVHSSARARGEDPAYAPDGARMFSHPVGVALGANGAGYDRAVPLKVDGSNQVPATPVYGDLVMSSESGTDKVRCLTCHKVHEAHSNAILQ